MCGGGGGRLITGKKKKISGLQRTLVLFTFQKETVHQAGKIQWQQNQAANIG